MARRDDFPEPEDNGQSFADMNVDGMPWHERSVLKGEDDETKQHYMMTVEERRAYILAAVGSAIAIMSVFAVAFAAFILFAQHIWLK